ESDYTNHDMRLATLSSQGEKLLLVAHSQGNLFVNHAYDYVAPMIGASSVNVVHIAPASATLRGDYILADIDLIIEALRLTSTDPVAYANIALPPSLTDITGHTLEGTYLDPARAARTQVEAMLSFAMSRLVTPVGSTVECDGHCVPACSNGQVLDPVSCSCD